MAEVIIDVETTGLHGLKEKIIGIGMRKSAEEIVFVEGNEKALLEMFWERISPGDTLIGFNLHFDWDSFLRLHSAKHKIPLKPVHYLDMMKVLNPKWMAKGKLEEYADFFGISRNGKYTGKDIPELWKEGKIDEIKKYLKQDVKTTWELWRICRERGLYAEWKWRKQNYELRL